MGRYKNFKMVIYCTAQNMASISKESLLKQLDFYRYYCGCDKVYLEPYRDGCMVPEEQLLMIKNTFLENGVEVSGALTTTCNNLSPEDEVKQRYGGTYCYSNQKMREHLVKTVEYTARNFDEFILDDWFFTYCTCEECRKAKGNKSWEQFRLDLLAEVSRELIIKPAKKVNPKCKVIIKFPNWSEAYQESGYNPMVQKDIFDQIYTGTENRNTARSDQHLPRYASYSLMRWLEHVAPGRNGGSWFDPYGCEPIDYYLEQAYLSGFARPREFMQFCWGSLYRNRVIAPLGLQLDILDKMLDAVGNPKGVPYYLPANAQGEDHVEDFLGMQGIPLDPTPYFPAAARTLFLTAQAHKDPDIINKLKKFVADGGKAVVTSGFMIEGLAKGMEEMTSIRYRGRRFTTNEFLEGGFFAGEEKHSKKRMSFPLLEHRNNTTWALAKAYVGEENYPILFRDFYGKGKLITLSVPDEYGYLYSVPGDILNLIREEFVGEEVPYCIKGPGQASLISYDNDTFTVYRYVSGLTAGNYGVKFKGIVDSLEYMNFPKHTIYPAKKEADSTTFDLEITQGDLNFYKIHWNENRAGRKEEFAAYSGPHDFYDDEEENIWDRA